MMLQNETNPIVRQIQKAQQEVAGWPKEKLQNVQLEGFSHYTKTLQQKRCTSVKISV
jgi:hypothetical protein